MPVLALDEGTTNAKAVVFDEKPQVLGMASFEFPQYYPRSGWVEHNPEEIWEAQIMAAKEALKRARIEPNEIAAIGVTNQRETTILWRKDGKPIYNAIVWQCRRTAEMVEEIKKEYGEMIREKTGLIPDSYFSAPKIKWIFQNVPKAQELARKGELMFGTVDSYLIYRLTGEHVTDSSNASRTMLFDIRRGKWDDELLELFSVPEEILPEVKDSSEIYGYTKIFGSEIPVAGDAGDQQASLFGQACMERGMVKVTYGTGNFLLANTGDMKRTENLLSTVAWSIRGKITYALEGSVFITGAALKWLRDSLKIISSYEETEEMGRQGKEGIYFVPAFSGLGAPYWDQYARGLIIGITRDTGREDIVRSALESIAYLTRDVVEEMRKEIDIREIRVDGGATSNRFLMQFQADILGIPIVRSEIREVTALGAAYLAGMAVDIWKDEEEIAAKWRERDRFVPNMDGGERERKYLGWKRAVKRAMNWAREVY